MRFRLAGAVKRLNVEHRTLNIDDATLYRFYNKRTAASEAPFDREFSAERLKVGDS